MMGLMPNMDLCFCADLSRTGNGAGQIKVSGGLAKSAYGMAVGVLVGVAGIPSTLIVSQ